MERKGGGGTRGCERGTKESLAERNMHFDMDCFARLWTPTLIPFSFLTLLFQYLTQAIKMRTPAHNIKGWGCYNASMNTTQGVQLAGSHKCADVLIQDHSMRL